MRQEQFEKIHCRLKSDHPLRDIIKDCDERFEKEEDKLDRMFNLVVAIAMTYDDISGIILD